VEWDRGKNALTSGGTTAALGTVGHTAQIGRDMIGEGVGGVGWGGGWVVGVVAMVSDVWVLMGDKSKRKCSHLWRHGIGWPVETLILRIVCIVCVVYLRVRAREREREREGST
jgi:hypothetical protein